jgi:hypothetical protein
MAGPSSLASNGLPYAINSFQVTGQVASTEAFDAAEANGMPISRRTLPATKNVEKGLPLDQLVVSFPASR